MQKKGFRRIQLLLLLIVVGLIIWRMTAPPAGTGFVTIADIDKRELESQNFEVFSPVTVSVEGEVSFEDDRAGSDLAVVAWILERESDSVVWKTTVDNVRREGVRATVNDSISLEPGVYSVYFSTLGPDRNSYREGSAFGLKPHWTNYEEFWFLDLRAPDGTVDSGPRVETIASSTSSSLFEVPLSARRSESSMMLHVSGSGTLRASGGFTRCTSGCDDISIKQVPDGVVVWNVDQEEAEPAGGGRINHWLDAAIDLPAGVYEISLDPGQHRGSWTENPPWQPEEFLFSVEVVEGVVRPVDPWAFGEPIVDQLGLGDSKLAQSRLILEDSLDVILYALGELTSSNQRYDWGWIEREGENETIWEMTYDGTSPAGGDSDNRQAKAILRLGPGSYIVSFETDGSHSYESFNRSRPRNPERWGMALFALDPDQAGTAGISVETIEQTSPELAPVDMSGSALDGIDGSRFLVRSTGLGNSADVTTRFSLDDTTRVVIMALGEITSSSQYDYGWLEDVGSGEIIWEMAWDNTSPAGGDDSYRRAREEIVLAAGSYAARFRTDGSVSFEGFGSDAPENPEDWGIAIFTADP